MDDERKIFIIGYNVNKITFTICYRAYRAYREYIFHFYSTQSFGFDTFHSWIIDELLFYKMFWFEGNKFRTTIFRIYDQLSQFINKSIHFDHAFPFSSLLWISIDYCSDQNLQWITKIVRKKWNKTRYFRETWHQSLSRIIEWPIKWLKFERTISFIHLCLQVSTSLCQLCKTFRYRFCFDPQIINCNSSQRPPWKPRESNKEYQILLLEVFIFFLFALHSVSMGRFCAFFLCQAMEWWIFLLHYPD